MQASAFDPMASDYDRSFTHSACGRTLRAMVWERLPAVFGTRRRILELGCGTGEDAIRLARAGHEVVAIDASAQMIRVAQLKAVAAGCADRIEFQVRRIEELGSLPTDQRFDGVFSNFGVINCMAEASTLARELSSRLVPHAPLLFVVMGRFVPWEWAWFLARGDRTAAFRRLRTDGVEWRGMRVHYPTPKVLAGQLEPWFDIKRRSALGFALPPSYAAAWLDRSPRALRVLSSIERATRHFTAGLADHFVIEASLRGARQ